MKNKNTLIIVIIIALAVVALIVASIVNKNFLSGQLVEIVGEKIGIVQEDGEDGPEAFVLPIPPDEASVPDEYVDPEIEVTGEVPGWGNGEPVVDGRAVELN